jgi:methyltransferase FkbM-like protein
MQIVTILNGKFLRVWTCSYEHLWGGLKHVAVPSQEGVYRILFGPGRGIRIWTNPAHGGTRILLGRYEPRLMRWLRSTIRPGSTFYDVGSNHGHIALIAAQLVGRGGSVYAFEPDETIRVELQRNLDLNPALKERIHVMPYAVGSIHDPATGKASIDGLLRQHSFPVGPPDALKIDVEGAECEVLDGMRLIADGACPPMFVECHSRPLYDTAKVFLTRRNQYVREAKPSLLEVSRGEFNRWIYCDRSGLKRSR